MRFSISTINDDDPLLLSHKGLTAIRGCSDKAPPEFSLLANSARAVKVYDKDLATGCPEVVTRLHCAVSTEQCASGGSDKAPPVSRS